MLIITFLATLVSGSYANLANATSFKKIIKQDHKIGKLTKNRAGIMGWYVKSKDDTYFCNMQTVIVDTVRPSSPDSHIGYLPDLKAGRPRIKDIGRCRKLRK